ncbi:phage tail tape measure protein [uncultured Selenomonas sp.]|uniref:phage tail tape measure protein n=1 Tax=uncultured Selenomonas sp. TaxID=159275 RepID=UPI0028EFA528|nr:phage tail tape measure protein [uncultured Selenomonas sp.]
MSDYVISAILRVKDELSGKTKKAKDSLSGVKSAAEGASAGLDHTESAMKKAAMSAVALAAKADKAKTELSGLRGTYAPTLSIKDKATEKITGIKGMLGSLSGKAYTATVNVRQHLSGAAGVASGLAGKAGGALSGMTGGMMMNTSMQMAGAAGIGMGIYDTVKTYMDFEAQMKKVQAISGASGADFDALTAKAKEMGAATQFSATESAQALEYMAMAGWKTDDMLGGISGIMDLAAASGEDLGRVSDIVTDALTAFGLQASDSAHFADVLAQASSNSNANVSMMGMTFKYVAPIAGALKYSIEDVGTAVGLMANAGIKGEQAGTSLRAMMTRLVDPPKEAGSAMDRLGITVKNADGTMKPFRQTMKDLRSTFAGLTDAEKAEAASAIAGQEAMSGFLAIVNASEADFDKLTASIDNAEGAAGNMAKTVNDNLKGDLKSLSSVWESVQLEFMSGKGADGLREFVQGVKDDVAKFKGYIEDGFDISDIGRSAMDVLVQLKNKFIELDGVGSLLAGGALAAGLYKIVSLSKKAVDGIKGLGGAGKPVPGGNFPTGVGEMVVHAGTVIVNGKGVAGGEGVPGAPGTPTKTTGKTGTSVSTASRTMLKGAAFGGGVAALFAAGDVYETTQRNNQLLKEAAYGIDSATENLNDLVARGASEDEINIAQQNLDEMKAYQAAVEKDNSARMAESIGGGAGSVIGAAIGTAIAGPLGMAIGGVVGEVLGEKIGNHFNDMANSKPEDYGAVVAVETKYDDYDSAFFEEEPEMQVHLTAPSPEDIQQVVADTQAGILTQSLTDLDGNAGLGWSFLTQGAEEASASVSASFAESNDAIKAEWASTPGYFESSVYEPTILGSEEAGVELAAGINAGAPAVKSEWGGVRAFFSGLFSYVAEGASSLFSSAREIIGLQSGGSGGGHFASGTSFAPGGWTEVNENGGEIIDLPQGSRVYPHATTMKMLRDSMGGSGSSPIPAAAPVTITGNTFHVREEADLDRIAYKLYQLMAKSHVNMNGGIMA